MQANQQVTFLADGGEDIRDLPRYLNPQAEHLLDWFHITMRITVLTQLAKGLRCPSERSANIARELQRLKWFLWHGNVFRSLQTVDDITTERLGHTQLRGALTAPARSSPPRSWTPRSTR